MEVDGSNDFPFRMCFLGFVLIFRGVQLPKNVHPLNLFVSTQPGIHHRLVQPPRCEKWRALRLQVLLLRPKHGRFEFPPEKAT